MKKATFFGMNPPFIGGAQNVLSRQEDERLIKNDLLQLIMTIPGERVMRPEFGVSLRSFVFEQLVGADLASLELELVQQIQRQEPRVTIDTIGITPDAERNGMQVKLVFRMKKDPKKELSIERFLALRA